MESKIKNVIVSILFITFLAVFFAINIIKPQDDISKSERRKLSKFPEISLENIISGDFMEQFEEYTLDQFAFRDNFRGIKAKVLFNIFCQKDNNRIYIEENHAVKYDNTLKESEVKSVADKINKLSDTLLKEMNIYYSVVPDKNYFLADKYGYPKMDYEKLLDILNNNIFNAKYIDLFNTLSIEDYYFTDTHWKQEKLDDVMKMFSDKMNFSYNGVDEIVEVKEPFYGVYYGQSALPLDSDKLKYGVNESIKNTKVSYLDEKTFKMVEGPLYDLEKVTGNDPYDLFLSGAKSLIVLENEKSLSDKELIIFRDSYGSSISPLFLEGYKKITLVDLRYIASPLFSQFVELKQGSDVLFLYCTDIINSGSILKVF